MVFFLRTAIILTYLGILLMVALIDWKTQIIYDGFHILILLLGILSIILFPEHSFVDRIFGATIISVPMLILTLVIPGAFGGGDIKLMAVSGFFLGTLSIICAMFVGILTGGFYAVVMLGRGKIGKKDQFAFGPFLAAGLAIAVLWGDKIMAWYLQFV